MALLTKNESMRIAQAENVLDENESKENIYSESAGVS